MTLLIDLTMSAIFYMVLTVANLKGFGGVFIELCLGVISSYINVAQNVDYTNFSKMNY